MCEDYLIAKVHGNVAKDGSCWGLQGAAILAGDVVHNPGTCHQMAPHSLPHGVAVPSNMPNQNSSFTEFLRAAKWTKLPEIT